MSTAITKPALREAIVDATAAAIVDVSRERDVSPARALARARTLAGDVLEDRRIAPALEPVSRLQSQTLRGIAIAAGAPLLVALGRALGVQVAEGAAAEIVSTLVSLAGAAYAWYGRETTTRPLK